MNLFEMGVVYPSIVPVLFVAPGAPDGRRCIIAYVGDSHIGAPGIGTCPDCGRIY